MAEQLFLYQGQLTKFQCEYQQRTKKKIFRKYIKEIDKQYQDILQSINENQLGILSTVLGKIKVQDLNMYNPRSIDICDYHNYLKSFNQNTINEFDSYGGYYGMHKNNQSTVNIEQFETLIENVMDVIDENQ